MERMESLGSLGDLKGQIMSLKVSIIQRENLINTAFDNKTCNDSICKRLRRAFINLTQSGLVPRHK